MPDWNVLEVADIGHAVAAIAHLALAVLLVTSGRLRQSAAPTRRWFLLALFATAAWAALAWGANNYSARWLPWGERWADALRYAAWLMLLMALLPPSSRDGEVAPGRGLRRLTGVLLLATIAWNGVRMASGAEAALPDRLSLILSLALPVVGLVWVEQFFRNQLEDTRWNAKPMALALACVFAFDIYLHVEALLFGQFDLDAYSVRAGAHALAVPLLWVAARRSSRWLSKLQVSRTAAFYSASLILAGGYLMFMAGVGYYVRYFGGEWGRALQLGMLAAALLFLAGLGLSGSLRSWLRVFVGKHFFSYRYDYREEWLRFTAVLSSRRTPQEMGEQIVRGLAKLVESPAGSLWTRSGTDADAAFRQLVAWNSPVQTETEVVEASLPHFLQHQGWVIDLDEFRASPKRYGELALPTWLLGLPGARLVVPLLAGDELQGFVVLAQPLTALSLNWEVLDLLKTAGRQAAGYLAQVQATEALLEARKFEAFNRMSAFVVHDLKNIVAQQSLMLKNAQRLRDNPEFQADMLMTVESSLEKMRRLMLQLREGATPPGSGHGVELAPIVQRLQALARGQGRELETQGVERLATRGLEERLERVLGHFVQNALDATPADGRVWIAVRRYSGRVQVEVGDTGVGMSEEFIRTRLFRPFNSTKHTGMGIGSYESHQYIRELGGQVDVKSQPGEGTVITVQLPLFESRQGDAWLPGAAR